MDRKWFVRLNWYDVASSLAVAFRAARIFLMKLAVSSNHAGQGIFSGCIIVAGEMVAY